MICLYEAWPQVWASRACQPVWLVGLGRMGCLGGLPRQPSIANLAGVVAGDSAVVCC